MRSGPPKAPLIARAALAVGVVGATLAAASGTAVAAPAGAQVGTVSPRATAAETRTLPSGHTDYRRSIAAYDSEMFELAARHPDLVSAFRLPYRTIEGRGVYGMQITDHVRARAGKPVLAIVGMHHGDEWPSGELAMEFGYDLVQHFGTDPLITGLLRHARVIIVPVVNPDGFSHNQRRNGENVDINRNYGLGWGGTGFAAGSGPFSEPESRNIRDLLSSHQVTTFITLHTCEEKILYPPLEHRAGTPQDEADFVELAQAMGEQDGYLSEASADDYETTGEVIDWSYYATRGLGYTIEIDPCDIPRSERGQPETFQSHVVDPYFGTGAYADKGNRGAFLVALERAAYAPSAEIAGKAPKHAVLRVSKDFTLWTSPDPAGTEGPPIAVPTHLSSTLVPPRPNGKFTWTVNPSVRPIPGYQRDGVHTEHPGFYQESWTLTCARPDGTVLQTAHVTVGKGQHVRVDLKPCKRRFHKKHLDGEG